MKVFYIRYQKVVVVFGVHGYLISVLPSKRITLVSTTMDMYVYWRHIESMIIRSMYPREHLCNSIHERI